MDHSSHSHGQDMKHYRHLALMALIHFPIMYVVMFTMIDGLSDFYNNLNMFYMAGMMVAPMVLLMPLMMGAMYKDKTANLIVYVASVLLFLLCFWMTREQTFIGDRQFIRSMIPHHSGAILMCEKSEIKNSELKSLCAQIVKGQREEIEQMKAIESRLDQ